MGDNNTQEDALREAAFEYFNHKKGTNWRNVQIDIDNYVAITKHWQSKKAVDLDELKKEFSEFSDSILDSEDYLAAMWLFLLPHLTKTESENMVDLDTYNKLKKKHDLFVEVFNERAAEDNKRMVEMNILKSKLAKIEVENAVDPIYFLDWFERHSGYVLWNNMYALSNEISKSTIINKVDLLEKYNEFKNTKK